MGEQHTRSTLWLALLLALVVAPAAQQRSIDDFFRELTDEWVRMNPNLAVATRHFTGAEQDRLEQQITSYADAARRQRRDYIRRGLADLAMFDRARMTDAERLSADLLRHQLQAYLDREKFEAYEFPLDQFNGANISLVSTLTVQHPLGTPRDASNYVIRLAQVAPRMAEAVAEARGRAAGDLIPPRFILDRTIMQMRRFVDMPAAQNPLVTSLNERASRIKELAPADRAALVSRAQRLVSDAVYPEWKTAIAFLESLLPRSADNAGLWRFEGGAAAYAHFLKAYTTTSLTADEIHEIGLRQVARLERDMDAVLRKLGRSSGTVNERIAQLRKDLSYPSTEDGRTRIMADIDVMIREAERRSSLLFDMRPKSPVVAQPYPRFSEANAAASYTAPPLDGSRPAIFQMPLRPDRMTKFTLRTLVHHETVPGHHFQIGLMVEDTSLPKFRQARLFGGISAITEGWALYAERLAAESGWYADDPEGLLGQMESELFRARRLVVDTGLHAKRWTRQQAIDYGISPSEAERYVALPGQACSYMIGQLKILELRDRAKAQLKEEFSERAFHNTVLRVGAVPLEMLEQEVERYIRAARPAVKPGARP
ncbi:MAG: DUF885 domain-containing protein [Acidobacteria bacterium]|nr:MAG: DUF885 domain-containing protein [Acidobacteriota bacterium]